MYTYTHIYGVYVGFTFVKIHCGGFLGVAISCFFLIGG